jgi:hypothetical protein
MLMAAAALKVLYPNLIHFTCLPEGLLHVAGEVKARFPKVNKLIVMTEESVSESPTSNAIL